MPREGVVTTYVVENNKNEITDLASFYSLPSTVVNHKQYKSLFAAYSFYNVSTRLTDLMRDMLTIAKQNNFDVFNALDLMDNAKFLSVRFCLNIWLFCEFLMNFFLDFLNTLFYNFAKGLFVT